MKVTRFANRAWAFVLAVLMTLTLIAPQALAANTVDPVEPASGKILVSQTDYTLIDGVTESDIFLNTKEGNAQIAGFMTTIAPGAKATFKASYNGYYTEGSTPASARTKRPIWPGAWKRPRCRLLTILRPPAATSSWP